LILTAKFGVLIEKLLKNVQSGKLGKTFSKISSRFSMRLNASL